MRDSRPPRSSLLAAVAWIYAPVVFALAAVTALCAARGIPLEMLTRDATSVAGVSPYVGAVSTVGLLLWCAAATICLFTAAFLRARSPQASEGAEQKRYRGEVRGFLWAVGGFTALLMLDDALLFHEASPKYFGVGDNGIFAAYVLLAAGGAVRWRAVIWRSWYGLLGIALLFFAAALAFDELHEQRWLEAAGLAQDARFLLEDGSKLLGISGWLGYIGHTCFQQLAADSARPVRSRRPQRSPSS